MYCNKYSERMISIAVQILKRQNPQTIQTLKNVLTYIPTSSYSEQILASAVVELSETCPETTCWLLQNPQCLQPELNAVEVITRYLSSKLSSWGFTCHRDFHFTTDGQLITSPLTKKALLSDSSTISSIAGNTATLSIIRTLLMTGFIAVLHSLDC